MSAGACGECITGFQCKLIAVQAVSNESGGVFEDVCALLDDIFDSRAMTGERFMQGGGIEDRSNLMAKVRSR